MPIRTPHVDKPKSLFDHLRNTLHALEVETTPQAGDVDALARIFDLTNQLLLGLLVAVEHEHDQRTSQDENRGPRVGG